MKERKELNIQMGCRIRNAREAAGYTQEQLAELIQVTPQYISDLERGIVGTSVPTLIRLCDVLSVSSDYLLMRQQERNIAQHIDPAEITSRIKAMNPNERRLAYEALRIITDAYRSR